MGTNKASPNYTLDFLQIHDTFGELRVGCYRDGEKDFFFFNSTDADL
jgi:hypothetical protein